MHGELPEIGIDADGHKGRIFAWETTWLCGCALARSRGEVEGRHAEALVNVVPDASLVCTCGILRTCIAC